MPRQSTKLIDFLAQGNFLTPEQVEECKIIAETLNLPMEKVILDKQILNDDQLGQIVADINGWRYINLEKEPIERSVVNLIPEKVAHEQHVISFSRNENGINMAMSNPDDTALVHLLEKSLNENLKIYYSTPELIEKSLNFYQKELRSEFEKLIQSHALEAVGSTSNENSVTKIVDLLITDAYKKNTSDVHIEPQANYTLVRYRIDGVMHDIITIPKELHDLIVTRIKIISQLRTDEHQAPQDGKFEHNPDHVKIDVRVSILPTPRGENVVLRLLADTANRFTLEDLGMSGQDLKILQDNIKKPWGMILVTGPTGSGKTTTLYAILKILNRREVHIATIEDPVEYNVDNITQVQVNPRAKLTFADGLRSLVRQDPNIIMVGEIRDSETASIAVNSAMTGHLVLSTLHTNDASTTLPRLLDMGIQPFLISSTVNIAIAQRLVRKICQKCIASYESTAEELSKKIPVNIVDQLTRGKKDVLLYKGKGCKVCQNTGYNGRLGVFEVLEVNDTIRELIIKNADAETIKIRALKNGMTTMFNDALDKVLSGITTVEELLRVIKY